MHILRPVLFILVGALVGFGYQRLIGCRSGACPIWSNPYASSGYGALLGLLFSGWSR